MKKICSTCHSEKDLSEFSRDRSKPDGLCYVCKECNKRRSEQYRKSPANKESLKVGFRKYAKTTKGHVVRRKVQNKLRSKQTSQKRIEHNMRVRIANGLRSVPKSQHTIQLIGCSWVALKIHLESLFQLDMTWNNYGKGEGKWSVDHIRPLTSFDLTSSEQQKQCFHYTNLQPLWYMENSRKGGKYAA